MILNKCVNSEFDIRDLIIKRQQEYSGVLMRELVFSKNIMKNPKLMRRATNLFNYDVHDVRNRDKTLPMKYKYSTKLNRTAISPEGRVKPLNIK